LSDHRIRGAAVPPVVLVASNHESEDLAWGDEDLDFDEDVGAVEQTSDPLAPWNRAMFHVNDRFYFWILKPVARGYGKVVPRPVRVGTKNFFHNLATPIRIVSCVLQGKGTAAGGELGSFLANSTLGLLGIFDVTRDYPALNPPEEDLGQALGTWGIGNGLYIVWPFLGPSTLRDSVGMVGGWALDPASYLQPTGVAVGVTTIEKVNATSFRIGDYETLRDAAIEPYEAFRDAYVQNRNKSVAE